ncbi:MAG: hypothetical protein D8H96_04305, partial [Lautropia sp.]
SLGMASCRAWLCCLPVLCSLPALRLTGPSLPAVPSQAEEALQAEGLSLHIGLSLCFTGRMRSPSRGARQADTGRNIAIGASR